MPAADLHAPAGRLTLLKWCLAPRRVPLAVLLGLYVAARVVILARYRVYTSVDSTSYADRPGNTVELLSFTGHAPRPWGVPLLYALAGSDRAGTAVQWAIGTIAWILLVCACWLVLRSSFARIGAASAVVGLALSRSVYSWDHAVLSESLSISLGIAALALLAIWARTRSRLALGALVVATVWWTFVRQDVLPYVLVLAVVLTGYALLRSYRRVAVVAVLVLLAGLVWNAATAAAVNDSYRAWYSGLSLSEATFMYRLRFQVLNDPQVAKAYRDEFGMPRCQSAEQIAGRPAWKMTEFIAAYHGCPDLVAWAEREKGSVAYRYPLAHPRHAAAKTVEIMPVLLGGTAGRYAEPVAAVPALPEQIFFPRPDRVLPLAGLIAVLAMGIGLLARGFRRARWAAAAGGILVLVSSASAVAGTLFTAGEYARFGIQEAVLVRVGLILLGAAAVDAAMAVIGERNGTARVDPSPTVSEPDSVSRPAEGDLGGHRTGQDPQRLALRLGEGPGAASSTTQNPPSTCPSGDSTG